VEKKVFDFNLVLNFSYIFSSLSDYFYLLKYISMKTLVVITIAMLIMVVVLFGTIAFFEKPWKKEKS
jgi:hypothetical protein